MTIFGSDQEKLLEYIKDAEQFDIEVRVPDINHSEEDFSILNDHTILYGFDSVKSLPERGVEEIIEKRPYQSINDIVERSQNKDLNKSAVDALTWSGALDSLQGTDRLKTLKEFYQARGDGKRNEDLPDSVSERYLLEKEKDYLGIYLTGHPLTQYQETIDWEKVKKTEERINVHGQITSFRVIQTKHGDDMAFVDLEFQNEYVNGVMFPDTFSKEVTRRTGSKLILLGRLLQEGAIVKVSAYFNQDNRGGLSFVIADMTVPVIVNDIMEETFIKAEEDYGYEPAPVEALERPAPRTL